MSTTTHLPAAWGTPEPELAALPMPAHVLSTVYVEPATSRERHVSLPVDLQIELDELLSMIAWNVAAKTLADYRPIIANYWHFCTANGLERFAVASLRDYVYVLAYPRLQYLLAEAVVARADQPGIGRSTLLVLVAAISKTFGMRNKPLPQDVPAWRQWLRGLSRRLAQPIDQKTPLLAEDLRRAVVLARSDPRPLVAARDAAILLLGWSCALRRSELARVHLEHLVEEATGWFLVIPKSKTDQDQKGHAIPVYAAADPDYDALLACQHWVRLAGVTTGPVFRRIDQHGHLGYHALTGHAIALILQRYALGENISGHSMRAGWVTQAAIDGKENFRIRVVTRHQGDAMIARYTRITDQQRQGPGPLL